MMAPGTWMWRARREWRLRDALGVVLVVVTALLYAVEQGRTRAADGPPALEAAEVGDLPAIPAALEAATSVLGIETDHRS